jgi:hypothetical protein
LGESLLPKPAEDGDDLLDRLDASEAGRDKQTGLNNAEDDNKPPSVDNELRDVLDPLMKRLSAL